MCITCVLYKALLTAAAAAAAMVVVVLLLLLWWRCVHLHTTISVGNTFATHTLYTHSDVAFIECIAML
jgi:hypothetical protein